MNAIINLITRPIELALNNLALTCGLTLCAFTLNILQTIATGFGH